MRILLSLGLLVGLVSPVRADDPLAAIEQHQQALFERIAPAVVFISTGSTLGSGFFVRGDGLVLTNAHVVSGRSQVDVVLNDGRRLLGTVFERAAGSLDLALVKVPVAGVTALPLRPASGLRVGSWVAAVGHGAGAIWTFNTGMVSNIYPAESDRPVFQTQIPLNPGNSGGPIVDRAGGVVGVVTARREGAEGVNFGIRIDVALRAFESLAGVCDCLVVDAAAGVPVLVDGRLAGTGPRVIVPAEARTHDVSAVIGGKLVRRAVAFPAVKRVRLE